MAERGFEQAAENLPDEEFLPGDDEWYGSEEYLDMIEDQVHARWEARLEAHLEEQWRQ
jgi:hypothetical protein